MDFDNIVEEDDNTCEKKIRAIANSLKNLDSYFRPKYKVVNDAERFKIYQDSTEKRFGMIYRIEGNIPEKVYCRLLDLIKSGSPEEYYEEQFGDFDIQFFDKMKGNRKLTAIRKRNSPALGFLHIGYFSVDLQEEYASKLKEAFYVV